MQAASSRPVSWTFKSFLKQCENAILSCMLRRVPCSEPFFFPSFKAALAQSPDFRCSGRASAALSAFSAHAAETPQGSAKSAFCPRS
jgi:hypothetical protein